MIIHPAGRVPIAILNLSVISGYSASPLVITWKAILLLAFVTGGCTSPGFDLDQYRGEGFEDRFAEEAASMRHPKDENAPEKPGTFSTRARQIEKNLGY